MADDTNQYLQYTESPPPTTPAQRPATTADPNQYLQYNRPNNDPNEASWERSRDMILNKARPPISAWDTLKGAYHTSGQSLYDFAKSIKDTYLHPIESAQALVDGVSKAPAVLRDSAGGLALNSLTPGVREMLVKDHPELQQSADTGMSLANAPKAVGDYVKNALISQPGEETGTAIKYQLKDHPFQSAADAATILTAPLGLSSLAGGAARLTGRFAGAGVLGRAAGAVEGAANTVGRAAALPAKLGDIINPINFVPDIPGNLVSGAGHVAQGLGAERVGNFLRSAGNAIKPTNAFSNVSQLMGRLSMSPEQRMFLEAAGPQSPAVAAALDAAVHAPAGTSARAGNIVPGSVATGPESVATTVNSPRLQVLGEKALKNQVDAASTLEQTRHDARVAHIENNVSGSPTDQANAITTRSANTAHDYGVSDATTFPIDADMHEVLSRPEGRAAISQININRANRGLPPISTGVGDTLDGVTVHQIKKQLDDARFRVSGAAKPDSDNIRAINDASTRFLDIVDRPGNNPMYRTSRENHARDSRVIDQQNTGNYAASLVDNPAAFAASLDNPANINTRNPSIPIATGSSRYAHHSDYMTDNQRAAFDAVSADHARAQEAARQAGHATDYSNEIDSAFEPIHTSPIMGLPGHIATSLFNRAIGHINPEVANSLSRSLLTPEGTLTLANNALTRQALIARRQAFAQKWIANPVNNALIRQPTMYNILDQQRNALRDATNQRLDANQ